MKRKICYLLITLTLSACSGWWLSSDPCDDYTQTNHYIQQYFTPISMTVESVNYNDGFLLVNFNFEYNEVNDKQLVLKYSSFYGDTLYNGSCNECGYLYSGEQPVACVSALTNFTITCNDSVVVDKGMCELSFNSYSEFIKDYKSYESIRQRMDIVSINTEQLLATSYESEPTFKLYINLNAFDDDILKFSVQSHFSADPLTCETLTVLPKTFFVDKKNRKWIVPQVFGGEKTEEWKAY